MLLELYQHVFKVVQVVLHAWKHSCGSRLNMAPQLQNKSTVVNSNANCAPNSAVNLKGIASDGREVLFTRLMGRVLDSRLSGQPHPENASFGLFSSCSRKPSLLV